MEAEDIVPDTVVVVGGVEFHHFILDLARLSEFFRVSVPNNQRHFDLGDRFTIDQWRALVPFLCPPMGLNDSAIVTADNVEMLLPMFHFLGMRQRLEDCDNLMMHITTENSCGEKEINSDVIAEFWKNEAMQERLRIFRQFATFHQIASQYNLTKTLTKTSPVLLGLLTRLDETVELFDVESTEKILGTVNYLVKDNPEPEEDHVVKGNELQSKLLELLHPHISNINLEDISPRALAALVQAYLKQKAMENREVKMTLELKAAKTIIASYQTFPGALFVKLPHRPTESTESQSQVRVALQEVMLDAYNRLNREYSLLGLEAPTVDDMNSIHLQIRDAIHHFVIGSDQNSTVGVAASDIYGFVKALLERLGSSDQMMTAFQGALMDLLRTGKIATFGTEEPPRFFITVRTNIL